MTEATWFFLGVTSWHYGPLSSLCLKIKAPPNASGHDREPVTKWRRRCSCPGRVRRHVSQLAKADTAFQVLRPLLSAPLLLALPAHRIARQRAAAPLRQGSSEGPRFLNPPADNLAAGAQRRRAG